MEVSFTPGSSRDCEVDTADLLYREEKTHNRRPEREKEKREKQAVVIMEDVDLAGAGNGVVDVAACR